MKKLSTLIFIASLLLVLFGTYLVMSASSTYSEFKFENQFHLFNIHLIRAVVGILFLIIFMFIPYEIYKDFSKLLLFISIGLLVLTLLLATEVKGARRWIDLGIVNFQPVDLVKIVLFIHLAALIENKGEEIRDLKKGFVYPLIWIIITVGLIIIQPNVSNGIILFLVSLIILWIGNAKIKHILSTFFVGGFSVLTAIMVFPHARSRFLSFIHSIQNDTEINMQVQQAIIGLGSGGIYGVGLGNSSQRNLFLPEAYGDFIFAILGEEIGFIGSLIILLIYLLIFLFGIIIAKNSKDKFGQLLGFAISFSFVIYAFINASVACGILPTTGLPLPLISYGGSSLITSCISLGILINIGLTNSRYIDFGNPPLESLNGTSLREKKNEIDLNNVGLESK